MANSDDFNESGGEKLPSNIYEAPDNLGPSWSLLEYVDAPRQLSAQNSITETNVPSMDELQTGTVLHPDTIYYAGQLTDEEAERSAQIIKQAGRGVIFPKRQARTAFFNGVALAIEVGGNIREEKYREIWEEKARREGVNEGIYLGVDKERTRLRIDLDESDKKMVSTLDRPSLSSGELVSRMEPADQDLINQLESHQYGTAQSTERKYIGRSLIVAAALVAAIVLGGNELFGSDDETEDTPALVRPSSAGDEATLEETPIPTNSPEAEVQDSTLESVINTPLDWSETASYVVRSGDTLSGIAVSISSAPYGSAAYEEAFNKLLEANGISLEQKNSIQVGQTLIIPAGTP